MMNSVIKGSIYTVAFFVTSEIVYKLYCKLKGRGQNVATKNGTSNNSRLCSRQGSSHLQVLFFPVSEVPCREYFITGNGCFKDTCSYSHSKSALSELYKHMLSCKKTIDVCIFVLTAKDLADVLVRLSKRGVAVRIITDKEQLQASGSQIWDLIRLGIPVRTNNSSYLMHHKFAIVDGHVLINGSFNWTRQAITGNQENLIITEDTAITSMFVNEFEKLWQEYAPNNVNGTLKNSVKEDRQLSQSYASNPNKQVHVQAMEEANPQIPTQRYAPQKKVQFNGGNW